MKQTEIGQIPEDWEIAGLQDNITLKARIGWQGLTTAEYRENGDYYLITGTDFKNGYIDWKNCVFVDKIRYDQDRNIQVNEKDILVTKDGTIGKVAYIDSISKSTTLNSGIFVLRVLDEKMDSRFIYYILMSFYFENFLKQITAGSTITHLYQKDFVHFNFIVPPLPEQHAIAEVLSDTDHWITSLENLIAKKQLIKQGTMQKLLTPKDDWEVKKLGDCLDYIQPTPYLVKSTEYNSNNKTPVLTAGKTFILGYTNEEFGIFNCLPTIIFDDFTTASKYVDFPFKAKSSAMKMLVLKNNLNNLKFLYEIMQVLRFQIGDHKRHWIGEFQNLEIKCPSLPEQERIATILSDMDAEIKTLEQKLAKAKQIKQGLMQELLTGRIRLVQSNSTKTAKEL